MRRKLRRQVFALFKLQKDVYLERFSSSTWPLREADTELAEEWMLFWDSVEAATYGESLAFLNEAALVAFVNGGQALASRFSIDFNLEHPRAVAYLREAGDKAITGINNTTRNRVNALLTKAVSEGWSYQRTAKQLEDLFDGFRKPPLVANRNYRTRADAIAVFETGDKYEGGAFEGARQLRDAGLSMTKAWLTVGDNRVRQTHRNNQSQNFIPIDKMFSSGHLRSPTDPGCRCTTLYQAKG